MKIIPFQNQHLITHHIPNFLIIFNGYADHFDIKKLIKFGTEVKHCIQNKDGSWLITWKNLNNDEIHEKSL
jgi:hypothetical protein